MTFPLAVFPAEGKLQLRTGGYSVRADIQEMNTQARRNRLLLLLRRPAVRGPHDRCRRQKFDAQNESRGHGTALLIKTPDGVFDSMLFAQIALHGLRRHIEDASVAKRAKQFDVFGVSPHQRHRRARWLSVEKFE